MHDLFAFTVRVIPSSLFCRQLLVSFCYLGLQLCPGPWSCILRSVRLNQDYFQLFISSVSATVLASRYSVSVADPDLELRVAVPDLELRGAGAVFLRC